MSLVKTSYPTLKLKIGKHMNIMKTLSSAVILISLASFASAETTYGRSFAITEPVGSMLTINLQSNSPSMFRGSFTQSFSFSQSIQNPVPVTNFSRNFVFGGSVGYNIVSQVNNTVSTFTNFDFSR